MTSIVANNDRDDFKSIHQESIPMLRHNISDDTITLSTSTDQSLHGVDNKENFMSDLYQNVEMNYESGKQSILKAEVLDAPQKHDQSINNGMANDALLQEELSKIASMMQHKR